MLEKQSFSVETSSKIGSFVCFNGVMEEPLQHYETNCLYSCFQSAS